MNKKFKTLSNLCAISLIIPITVYAENSEPNNTLERINSGGQLTVQGDHSRVLLSNIETLTDEQNSKRRRGHAFFNTLFISGESEVPKREGLGPLFNGASCEVCHNRLGRGRMPLLSDTQPSSLVFQLSSLSHRKQWQDFHPVYGKNFNPFATPNVPDEGRIKISHTVIKGQYVDGSSWQLLKPEYQFIQLNYGPFEHDSIIKTAFSPRLGQSLIGMGLLEAISDEAILKNEDPNDLDQDGISGRAHRIQKNDTSVIGRFGWKATQAKLINQITDALSNEQGIKTRYQPHHNCTSFQQKCIESDALSNAIELIDEDLTSLVFFTQTIPVPERRNSDHFDVIQGQRIFNSISCQKCHVDHYITSYIEDMPVLSEQAIYPYTDLLLHDMGEALSDNRPVGNASAREWRTPPLWGIGLNNIISGDESYLHDGRAKTLEQAILWHGGEAETAKNKFTSLTKTQRDQLIAFLKSL